MDDLQTMHKILTESLQYLSEYLEPEDVMRSLIAKGAITNNEAVKIRKKDTSPEQVDCLLEILRRKPVTSYITFMEVLKTARSDLHVNVQKLEKKYNFNQGDY